MLDYAPSWAVGPREPREPAELCKGPCDPPMASCSVQREGRGGPHLGNLSDMTLINSTQPLLSEI